MAKLLQINICSNVLSTGKICEDIAKVAMQHGWECYTAYGRMARKSVSKQIRVGSTFSTYEHYAEHKMFDREGLASRFATQQLIKQIRIITPDIIHLHNIHDHYLNYPILFRYLASIDTPVVWTQHDCWAFTGGCMYFDILDCNKWKCGCSGCPEKRAWLCNQSRKQFALKKHLLDQIKRLTYVPVSDWLHSLLQQSVQRHREIITIHNGVDISTFKPTAKHCMDSKFGILGVAAVWDARKGLTDFIKLRTLLPADYKITLVGLSQKQIATLPQGIEGIQRTQNVDALVKLFADADVFVNPTYSDNFPTTNLEALACGTPVITYRTGGSPEAVDEQTGVVVEQGDVEGLAKAIQRLKTTPISTSACRERAVALFDKDQCFEKYIALYDHLIEEKRKTT